MTTKPEGLIIIRHEVLGAIPMQEVYDALPEAYQGVPLYPVSINPQSFQHGESMHQHWPSLLAEQERLFKESVIPKLEEYPECRVLYFGLAPIPLAIHLGNRLHSMKRVEVFLKHQTLKHWVWPETDAEHPIITGVPGELNKGGGDVVLRLGTRFPVHEDDVERVVPEAVKDMVIAPTHRGSDIFGSHEQVARFAGAVRASLDAVKGNLPNARAVHLFAAIPSGLAFLIGQEISPNAHPLVYVYEFDNDRDPKYDHIFTVNEELATEAFDISDRERKAFQKLREAQTEDIQQFQAHLIPNLKEANPHWLRALWSTEDQEANPFEQDYWNTLDRLDRIPLDMDFLSVPRSNEELPIRYFFTDAFLKVLGESLTDRSDLELAARLFCFRQSVRQTVHGIQPKGRHHSARYPRITEEADYQADVYALLNEFFLQDCNYDEASGYFSRMIRVLTETMWAFDKVEGSREEMEVQRTNAYLCWYYLASMIEVGDGLPLSDILSLLARKPIIELRLHALENSASDTLVFDFGRSQKSSLGIAVFHNGRMVSRGNEEGELPLTDLMEGFRTRKPDLIKQVIRALHSKI